MVALEVIFWIGVFIVFYTYIGYGIILWLAVKIKEKLHPPVCSVLPDDLPQVTLFIAAYNEQDVIAEKMANCRALDYPADKLNIVWVTDGSDDRTNDLLSEYSEVTVYYQPERRGKTAAFNRAVPFINTPYIVFTDANTMLNPSAVTEIVRQFSDPSVGCVAGEKRVVQLAQQSAEQTEGIYWKYESFLKDLDFRLYTAVGAAGELFAIRTELFQPMPEDTLLDDFTLSLRIVQRGYRTAYCRDAYAYEDASANMKEEGKRKVRISAGGLQSVYRLRSLLNIFRYGVVSWQYVSHRVLRWTVTPVVLFLLYPLNVVLALSAGNRVFYIVLLALQTIFYICGWLGSILAEKRIKNKFLFVPYYFLFMNINVFKGMNYLIHRRGTGVWEKAKRAGNA